jgi:hypothetical protein
MLWRPQSDRVGIRADTWSSRNGRDSPLTRLRDPGVRSWRISLAPEPPNPDAASYAAAPSLLLFLLPGGRPRRFNADIQAGGRPRRFPRPLAKRSKVTIASSTCSRSWRKSASIFKTSIVSLTFPFDRFLGPPVPKNEQYGSNCTERTLRFYPYFKGISRDLFRKRNKKDLSARFLGGDRRQSPGPGGPQRRFHRK